jgi:predicted AAA+ superfamily ATPase
MFGGVLITGPKWCGKTWTGTHHSKSSARIDDEDARLIAMTDPKTILAGEEPRLIDEWQDVPKLWDAARRNIDDAGRNGMYVFVGSSVPSPKPPSHTGTGRFDEVRMRTMSLFESGDSSGKASLSEMFATGGFEPAESSMSYAKAIDLICVGGWPAHLRTGAARTADVPRAYIRSLISSDMARYGGVRRDPVRTERILRSVARNSATTVKKSTIAGDASDGERGASELTVYRYLDALEGMFAIEEQPAWSPSLRSKARVRASPKIHFADPSLAAAAMRAGPEMLRGDAKTSGFLFESLCHRDLCVYSTPLDGTVYHYRDSNGLEVDAVIELPDGRWGAVEVKMGSFEFDKAADSLLALKDLVGGERGDPSFLMILSASGGYAYPRGDGTVVVPIDCLGP